MTSPNFLIICQNNIKSILNMGKVFRIALTSCSEKRVFLEQLSSEQTNILQNLFVPKHVAWILMQLASSLIITNFLWNTKYSNNPNTYVATKYKSHAQCSCDKNFQCFCTIVILQMNVTNRICSLYVLLVLHYVQNTCIISAQ